MGSREENIGREEGMEGGREGGWKRERQRVGSLHICFVTLNTCVGRVQAT